MRTFFLFALVLFIGVLVAYAPVPAVIISAVLAGVLLLFVLPDRLALWTTVVTCYVLVGPAESLGRVPKVFWVSYLLGLFLLAKALLVWTKLRSATTLAPRGAFLTPVFVLPWVLVFIAVFGSIAAKVNVFQFILGSRDYLWLWGFLALVLASRISLEEQTKWFRFLPWVVVLQVPLVLYQRFFVLGATHFTTHDAVVGLFGGNPEGGGASGAMGFFSLLMALYTIGRMRNGCASRWTTLLVVGSALISIALAEVKYVAIVAPIVAIAFFGIRDILKSARTLVWIAVFIAAGPAILYGYWKSFEAPGAKGFGSFERYVTVILERNVDDQQIDFRSGEMGRIAAIRFWSLENPVAQQPLKSTVGHGIGASRIGLFEGEVARKYRYKVARSSLTVLLWEVGIAGTACTVLLLLLGWKKARILAKVISDSSGESGAVIQLVAAVFFVAILTLPYNTDLVGTPQFQLLLIMCVGALSAEYRVRCAKPALAKPTLSSVACT